MGRIKIILAFCMIMICLVSLACTISGKTPSDVTLTPTKGARPTRTPRPTREPRPTLPPRPTRGPRYTATPTDVRVPFTPSGQPVLWIPMLTEYDFTMLTLDQQKDVVLGKIKEVYDSDVTGRGVVGTKARSKLEILRVEPLLIEFIWKKDPGFLDPSGIHDGRNREENLIHRLPKPWEATVVRLEDQQQVWIIAENVYPCKYSVMDAVSNKNRDALWALAVSSTTTLDEARKIVSDSMRSRADLDVSACSITEHQYARPHRGIKQNSFFMPGASLHRSSYQAIPG